MDLEETSVITLILQFPCTRGRIQETRLERERDDDNNYNIKLAEQNVTKEREKGEKTV